MGERGWPVTVFIAVLAVLAVAVVLGLYLVNVWRSHFDLPPGNDIPQYLLRTRLTMDRGLHSLLSAFPSPFQANPDRPGFPAFASVLHGLTAIPTLRQEFVLPAVGAAVVGLAAGGFALAGLGESPWVFPVYVLAVGASVNVAVTAGGHFDNLLVDAMFLGAAAAALRVVDGGAGAVALAMLIAAAVVTHWLFAVLFVLILLGLAVIVAITSIRSGDGFRAPPTVRLGRALGLSVAAGAGSWLLVPGFQLLPVVAGREDQFLGLAVRSYRLPIVGPLAAGGAARIARRRSWRALTLLLIWTGVGVGALLVLLIGRSLPANRVWPFALAVPILATAGVIGVARWGWARLGRIGLGLGVLVVVAGLFGQAYLQRQSWSSVSPLVSDRTFAQARTIGRYMERIGGSRPVVVAVNTPKKPSSGIRIAFRWIRAAVPLDEMERVFVYLGTVPTLLAGRPEIRAHDASFNRVSRQYWPEVRAAVRHRPIVLVASEFYRGFGPELTAHPGWRFLPGLAVVRGPRAAGVTPAPLPRGPSRALLVMTAVLALMVITAIGLGWSFALLSGALLGRVALAPTFGVAVAALAGLIADRAGFRLSEGTALTVGLVSTAGGWVAFVLRRAVRSRRGRALRGAIMRKRR